MAYRFPVSMLNGTTYHVQRLLTKGESNAKLAKSNKSGLGYLTVGLSLSPASSSGFNLCASASAACIKDCLHTSGYAAVHPRKILPAREAKARMLRIHPDDFRNRLCLELAAARKRARKLGLTLCVRLNVLSDVMWEREFPAILNMFHDVQFYDYTKHYLRMLRYLNGELPPNYHLTFSWSGENRIKCEVVLEDGGNVAVPFHVKYFRDKRQPLPAKFLGYNVVDGDINDLRFLDPKGQPGNVVGLRAKGKAKTDFESGFVIKVENGEAVGV